MPRDLTEEQKALMGNPQAVLRIIDALRQYREATTRALSQGYLAPTVGVAVLQRELADKVARIERDLKCPQHLTEEGQP